MKLPRLLSLTLAALLLLSGCGAPKTSPQETTGDTAAAETTVITTAVQTTETTTEMTTIPETTLPPDVIPAPSHNINDLPRKSALS